MDGLLLRTKRDQESFGVCNSSRAIWTERNDRLLKIRRWKKIWFGMG